MNECNCSTKRTDRTDEEKKRLINRLSRIEGQIRGIKRMVEQNNYCIDILTQSSAAYAAINSFNKDLISSHIRGCVVRDIREGKEETVDELITAVKKLME